MMKNDKPKNIDNKLITRCVDVIVITFSTCVSLLMIGFCAWLMKLMLG